MSASNPIFAGFPAISGNDFPFGGFGIVNRTSSSPDPVKVRAISPSARIDARGPGLRAADRASAAVLPQAALRVDLH